MKNLILIVFAGLLMVSCKSDAEKAAESRKQAVIDSIKLDTRVRLHDISLSALERITKLEKAQVSEFNNPVFIMGSSFGNYFQSLYKLGKYDQMIKFTSTESIRRMGGKDKVKELYANMKFAYDMKLKSQSFEGDTTILNYETGIYATKHMLRLPVIIENDSTKLVLSKSLFKSI